MPFFYDKDDLDAQPRGCSCFDRDGEQMRDLVMGSSPRLIESGYFEIPVLLSKIFPKWTRKVILWCFFMNEKSPLDMFQMRWKSEQDMTVYFTIKFGKNNKYLA